MYYHIFLLAQTQQGRVLFETTDPINGFVTDPNVIDLKITEYKSGIGAASANNASFYEYKESLYRKISLQQLQELLWYNATVGAYNAHNLVTAAQHLSQAFASYRSPRLHEFSEVLEMAVFESSLAGDTEIELIRAIRSLRAEKSPAFALNTSSLD